MSDEKTGPIVIEEKVDPKVIKITEGNRPVVVDEAFKELRASIGKDGLLNPILVSVSTGAGGKSTYLLIAGERRLRACLDLKMDEIPVRSFVADDDALATIRVVENLHRKNLGAIEEAVAFKAVADKWGDVKTVASAVGKTMNYVSRSLGLLTLPKKVVAFIASGELTAAHGHQLLRLDVKGQERFGEWTTTRNDWTKKLPTVDELKREIETKVEKELKKAPWDLGKEIESSPLDKGKPSKMLPACSGCPHNTGNQDGLFDGAVDGKCTNPSCYSKKMKVYFEDFAYARKEKYEKMKYLGIVAEHGYMGDVGSVKGNPLLDEKTAGTAPIKKAMADHPEAFGWCVVKPSAFSDKKTGRVGIAVLDQKVLPKEMQQAPKQRQQTAEEYALQRKKEELVRGIRNLFFLRALDDEFDGGNPTTRQLVDIAARVSNRFSDCKTVLSIIKPDTEIKKPTDALKVVIKFDRANLMRFIWLATFGEYELMEHAKGLDLNVKKILAEADKVAAEELKKTLDTPEPKS